MYGRYTKDLGEYAKDEARRLRLLERRRKKDDKARNKVSESNLSDTSISFMVPGESTFNA